MNKALSSTQQRALDKLKETPDKWRSSYSLQESLSTLDSLARRGLINRRAELGSMAFPHNNIVYRIKKEETANAPDV
jgi:hypothetical protein